MNKPLKRFFLLFILIATSALGSFAQGIDGQQDDKFWEQAEILRLNNLTASINLELMNPTKAKVLSAKVQAAQLVYKGKDPGMEAKWKKQREDIEKALDELLKNLKD